MKAFNRKLASVALIVLTLGAVQIGTALSAFAADAPTDLSISANKEGDWNTFTYRVCNNGPTTITSFNVDTQFTNFSPTKYQYVIFADTNATDSNIDPDTGAWTGTMESGQCVEEYILGNVTGNIGENLDMTATITNATLSDSTENVDTNPGDETATTATSIIKLQSDLSIATRLITPGPITSGMTVSYELTVSNIGLGDYIADSSVIFAEPQVYFLMPAGATFTDLVDLNPTDILDVATCFPIGDIQTQLPGSPYEGFIQGCQLNINSGTTIPAGSTYSFEFQMSTTSGFTSGTTEVFGISIGNDADTIFYFARLSLGEDFLATPVDNIFHLTFDSTELVPTINPCAGQGSVVNTNSACFTISFNKEIYEPSFTQASLVVTGTGTITSFNKTSDNLWTVVIGNLEVGKSVSLSLTPSAIQDLSAVVNTTKVLGINTVRYEVATTTNNTTSSTGTLPVTGSDPDWSTPAMLIFTGLCLAVLSRNKMRAPQKR